MCGICLDVDEDVEDAIEPIALRPELRHQLIHPTALDPRHLSPAWSTRLPPLLLQGNPALPELAARLQLDRVCEVPAQTKPSSSFIGL